jgi:hypothetical protein
MIVTESDVFWVDADRAVRVVDLGRDLFTSGPWLLRAIAVRVVLALPAQRECQVDSSDSEESTARV